MVVLENATVSGAVPESGEAVNVATGAVTVVVVVVTLIGVDAVTFVVPPGPVAVNEGVKLPATEYVCEGFCAVLVVPSPKSQLQLVTVPVVVFEKLTFSGAVPVSGEAEKLVTGALYGT